VNVQNFVVVSNSTV